MDGSTDLTIGKYVFKEDLVFFEYQRYKYNLIDILSELGGLFNSFYLIGFAFTVSFSYNLMLSSIMRNLYHFPAKFKSEISKKKKGKKGKDGAGGLSSNIREPDGDQGEGENGADDLLGNKVDTGEDSMLTQGNDVFEDEDQDNEFNLI